MEIELLDSDHKNQIEKIELEYKLQKDNKSSDISSEMAKKFFSGDLDISNVLEIVVNLKELQTKINKLNK